MLGCIYQLWDWLEAPPLFTTATMDAKKLQQFQQTQNVQKKLPLANKQANVADYRSATHSPTVFQHKHQQKQQPTDYYTVQRTAATSAHYLQSPTTTSSTSGPLSPIDMQPHTNKILLSHQMGGSSGGNTSSSAHSSPYHQASTSSSYPTSSGGTGAEQLYQSPTERTYLAAAGRLQGTSHNAATALQQQYQQLQQAKLQAQLQTQNEAIQNQQRTFALRQAMNPPVPQGHYHISQSASMMSALTQQSTNSQKQRAPPSSININNNIYPAVSDQSKVSQPQQQQHFHQHIPQQQQQQTTYHRHQENIYGLHHQQQLQHQQVHYHPLQQRSKSDLQTSVGNNDQSPVYIQQNHPGHVMNQACQTQISAVAKTNQITKTPSSEDSSSASVKSPTHTQLDRKKSSGACNTSNTQALKSPLTKRPPSSPVTMSDWLYKQGSDGLKVWRKRWFVLAEYCLYYYKGPEEEKLLGSILLPSYKVSPCSPEDKIYRKHAFKCEHQNMRTYWLAAENADAMTQWVRALSAATMMQAPANVGTDSSGQPSAASSSNQSGENSDSGIHTLQSQQSKLSSQGQVTPASDHSGNAADAGPNSSGGGVSTTGGGSQPLYANAPPKPRRITDGGYSSPSPEHCADNERRTRHYSTNNHMQQQQKTHPNSARRSGVMSPTLQQMQQHQQQYMYAHNSQSRSQHHVIYDTRTGNVSSSLRRPQQKLQQQMPTQLQPQPPVYGIDALEMQYQQQMSIINDEYPKTSPTDYMDAQMEAQIMQLQQQRMAIGDDTYGERELYMQRIIQQRYPQTYGGGYRTNNAERRTPDAYGRSKNRVFSDYEDIYNFTQGDVVESGTRTMSAQEALLQEAASYRRPLSPPTYDGNKHIPTMPAHYTPNHLEAALGQNITGSNSNMHARPVAAIVRPHSADFLEYESRPEIASDAISPTSLINQNINTDAVRAPRPKSSLDINRTPDSFYYSEENYAEKMRESALYLQHPQSQVQTLAQPQQAGLYKTMTSSNDYLNSANGGMHTIAYENPYERAHKRSELLHDALSNTTGHASIPRLSRAQMLGAGSHVRSQSTHPHVQSPDPQSGLTGLTTQQIIQQNEQFLRSASARLPKRGGSYDEDEPQSPCNTNAAPTIIPAGNQNTAAHNTHLEGERKREESMKRLLEWKQRMLQSPLTRKSVHSQRALISNSSFSGNNNNNNSTLKSHKGNNVSAVSQLGSNPNILLSSTTVASGVHYPSKRAGYSSASVSLQRSHSETHANSGPSAGYNSYSSDDEDTAGNDKKASAGRFTLRPTISTQSIYKEEVATNVNSTGGSPVVPNSTVASNVSNDIPIITTATQKATIAVNDTVNSPLVQKSVINTEQDNTLRRQKRKLLKPILKTKIVNVTPLNHTVKDSIDANTAKSIVRSSSYILPKITNAIDTNAITSDIMTKPIDDYKPVYFTKASIDLNAVKCSNSNHEAKFVTEDPSKREDVIYRDTAEAKNQVNVIAPDTIMDAEVTPILTNLNLFKEKEEECKNLATSNNVNDCNKFFDKHMADQLTEESAEPENEEDTTCEYTDDDLNEALAVEANMSEEMVEDNFKGESQIYENDPPKHPDESHYCLMTPKRSESGQMPFASITEAVTSTAGEEENHYVEMTKQLQEEDSKSSYEYMCLSSNNSLTLASSAAPKQINVQNEPVYMELPACHSELCKEEGGTSTNSKSGTIKKSKKSSDTAKKKSKKSSQERNQTKRNDLPDIVKPSQSKLTSNSDSSDADDESSKNMELKKMRSRSRFSLSDTFRPASYYLGASTPLADFAESSDSEIVPPPSIPNSPPSLEELNRTEEIFSAENYDTVKRRNSGSNSKLNFSYDPLTKIHASNNSLNIPKTEGTLKSSRLSLPDQFGKIRPGGHLKVSHSYVANHHERTLSDSNYSFQTDNSSNTSSDFDLYNKLKQNSPSYVATPVRYQSNNSLLQKFIGSTPGTGNSSETDSVELRHRQSSDTELDRQRSRRPLSEESISEIESLNEKYEDAMGSADLDTYLNDLQISDLYMYQNDKNKNRNVMNEGTKQQTVGTSFNHLIKPPKTFRTKEGEHFYGNIHFVSSTDSLQKLTSDNKDNRCQTLQSKRTLTEDFNDMLGASSSTPTRYMTPMHSRNNSNLSEQSAPYYYSELTTQSTNNEMVGATPITLNNQRDVHATVGANIAHIHNPIERMPNINVEILTDKENTFDSRNLYKTKTNIEKLSYTHSKSWKSGESLQQTTSQVFHIQQMESAQSKINNYQQNLALPTYPQQHSAISVPLPITQNITSPSSSSSSPSVSTNIANHVGPLVADGNSSRTELNEKNTNLQKQGTLQPVAGLKTLSSKSSQQHIVTENNKEKLSVLGAPISGELLWEEDALWRESLRRVSQRHARSLDDLDRILGTPMPTPSAPFSVTQNNNNNHAQTDKRIKSRLSREVTYVNDNISQNMRSSFKKHTSESLATNKNYNNSVDLGNTSISNEHDVYVQLSENPLISREVKVELYELLREESGSNISSNKSTEIDRETIRQWDSMSSGLMKGHANLNNVKADMESSDNNSDGNINTQNTENTNR